MFNKLNNLKIFFEDPIKEFNVREVARILEISPATASKKLKEFAKQNILMERKQKIFHLYKTNLESDCYRDLKIYYNLRKIKDSGLTNALDKFYLKPTIVLFGSAAFGLDTKTSDFDILVISEKTKEFSDLKRFEKKMNRKLHLFIVKNIKELKNKHLINNIINGITLQGNVKWI